MDDLSDDCGGRVFVYNLCDYDSSGRYWVCDIRHDYLQCGTTSPLTGISLMTKKFGCE